jgi:hypothetical protein
MPDINAQRDHPCSSQKWSEDLLLSTKVGRSAKALELWRSKKYVLPFSTVFEDINYLWHGWNTLPQGSTRHEGPDDEMHRTTPLISLLNESFNMSFESDVVAFYAAPSWRYTLSKNRRDSQSTWHCRVKKIVFKALG